MKKIYFILQFTLSAFILTAQSVGIGTTAPNSSSILDVNSTDKGMLIPRMTAAQRTSIASPAKGLLVYQTQAPEGFYYNNGTPSAPNWIMLGGTGPQGPQGVPGPVGPMGIVNGYYVAGTTAYPSNVLSFISPTVTITLQAGQSVFLVATKALGGYDPATDLGIYPACQSTIPFSPIVNLGLGMFGLEVPANTRINFTVNGVFKDLPAGTYKFGMSGIYTGSGISQWTNCEWGYVSALVF